MERNKPESVSYFLEYGLDFGICVRQHSRREAAGVPGGISAETKRGSRSIRSGRCLQKRSKE